MNLSLVLLLSQWFSLVYTKTKDLKPEEKEVSFEPVGCFRDTTKEPRPLPLLVKNYRWPAQIDWDNLNKTIRACAREVQKRRFLYFSLQFYGECWSGPQAHKTFDEDGESNRCVLGVGMARANFVYRIILKECKDYTVLNSADRSPDQGYKPTAECDYRLKHAWYRFQGKAGDTMAGVCPGRFRCGTIVPGWLNGTHPAVEDGVVERKVCFHQNKHCCYAFVVAKVRDCGGFYVYKLPPAPYCQMRYCGSGVRAS